jgi:membrane protease YdiL (CAAX protease family)
MDMDLTTFDVRPNWQEYNQATRNQGLRTWRLIVLSVSLFTLFLFFISFIFQPTWAGWGAIRTIFVPIFYLSFSFWLALRISLSDGLPIKSYYKILFGIRAQNIVFNVLVGGLGGGILGLSFISMAIYLLPEGFKFGSFASGNIVFAVLFQLFLSSLGEEFLLRGLAYTSLYERGQESIGRTLVLISIINLVIYLVQFARFIGTSFSIWLVIYRIAFGLMATILRYRQDTTITTISCNFIFNILVASILPW